MILALRTDKPEAELYLYQTGAVIDSVQWLAHRELSDTLLTKIEELLSRNTLQLADLTGLVVYKGPGSFTGLRIGITVANSLGYALGIPILGVGEVDWHIEHLPMHFKTDTIVIPEYGQEATITKPRK